MNRMTPVDQSEEKAWFEVSTLKLHVLDTHILFDLAWSAATFMQTFFQSIIQKISASTSKIKFLTGDR